MKIVSRNTGYLSRIERYDLQDIFVQPSASCGLIICYALATFKNLTLVTLDLIAEHEEIGVIKKWHNRYSYDSFIDNFHNLQDFLELYDADGFGRWTAEIRYRNVGISITGIRESTEIALSYPKDKTLNIFSLLSEIEQSTFKFNNYDSNILNILKSRHNMSEKRAVLTIQKLIEHKDIYDEFATVITSGRYADPSSAVTIEGYTAESLVLNDSLSLIGAYNVLIYLRELPEEALKELKRGLPKK